MIWNWIFIGNYSVKMKSYFPVSSSHPCWCGYELKIKLFVKLQFLLFPFKNYYICFVCNQNYWNGCGIFSNEISNIKLNADVLIILCGVKNTLPRKKYTVCSHFALLSVNKKSLPRLIFHNNAKNAIVECTLHKNCFLWHFDIAMRGCFHIFTLILCTCREKTELINSLHCHRCQWIEFRLFVCIIRTRFHQPYFLMPSLLYWIFANIT